MAHEILSVKMYELDKKIGQLHSRILMNETASHAQIREELKILQKECAENALTLQNKLRFSKSGIVSELGKSYDEVERIIQRTKEKIEISDSKYLDDEISVEEKILFAEYALDFAIQAANHALLISMEALDANMSQQEEEGKKS